MGYGSVHVDVIRLCGPVVFFTGAGISVGAGLPTYRGRGGLYENTDLEPPNASDVTPERLPALWERLRPRLAVTTELQPARAHVAIAELETRLPGAVTVVTQNVDGLHGAAGSRTVHELHGSLRGMRCLGAGHASTIADAEWADDGVPRCPTCGAPCRPAVVLFGEPLPPAPWEEAVQSLAGSATVVAVGTSAQVYPAAGLISLGRTPRAARLWVNPETPPPDAQWQWLRGDADTVLDRLRA
jgi:NAD-dependent deacetylase